MHTLWYCDFVPWHCALRLNAFHGKVFGEEEKTEFVVQIQAILNQLTFARWLLLSNSCYFFLCMFIFCWSSFYSVTVPFLRVCYISYFCLSFSIRWTPHSLRFSALLIFSLYLSTRSFSHSLSVSVSFALVEIACAPPLPPPPQDK